MQSLIDFGNYLDLDGYELAFDDLPQEYQGIPYFSVYSELVHGLHGIVQAMGFRKDMIVKFNPHGWDQTPTTLGDIHTPNSKHGLVAPSETIGGGRERAVFGGFTNGGGFHTAAADLPDIFTCPFDSFQRFQNRPATDGTAINTPSWMDPVAVYEEARSLVPDSTIVNVGFSPPPWSNEYTRYGKKLMVKDIHCSKEPHHRTILDCDQYGRDIGYPYSVEHQTWRFMTTRNLRNPSDGFDLYGVYGPSYPYTNNGAPVASADTAATEIIRIVSEA